MPNPTTDRMGSHGKRYSVDELIGVMYAIAYPDTAPDNSITVAVVSVPRKLGPGTYFEARFETYGGPMHSYVGTGHNQLQAVKCLARQSRGMGDAVRMAINSAVEKYRAVCEAEIRADYESGLSTNRIASGRGMCNDTVLAHLKRAGVKIRPAGRPSRAKPRPVTEVVLCDCAGCGGELTTFGGKGYCGECKSVQNSEAP